MATVKFTYALKRFFPRLTNTTASGKTLRAVLDELEARYPGVTRYVLDDQGHIRKHVAVFINQTMVMDRQTLTQPLASGDSVLVIQALTGG